MESARRARPRGVLRRAREGVRARARGRRQGRRRLPLRSDAAQPDRAAGGHRRGAPGAVPAPEHGARRHRDAGGDAPRAAARPEEAPGVDRHRRRPAAPVPLLVQPRLPAPGAHRLAHPGDRAGEADRIRGGARGAGLARPAPAARSRPALLRVLPPAAARRAADLHRGRADARHERAGAAAARHGGAGGDGRARRPRDVLLDHQLPGGPARHFLRQPADQAGGGGTEARIAAPAQLRDAVADSRLPALARGARHARRACRSARRPSSGTRCWRRSRSRAGIPAPRTKRCRSC